MWHIVQNLIAAPIFAILSAVGALPLVMSWGINYDHSDPEMLAALVGFAAVVFLAVLFTPRSKGGLFRGLRLSGIFLMLGGGFLIVANWTGLQTSVTGATGAEKYVMLVFGGALMLIPVCAFALGLIFFLLSRRPAKPG